MLSSRPFCWVFSSVLLPLARFCLLLLRVVEALCYRILDERMRLSSLRASLCCLAAAAAKQEPRALAAAASLESSTHLAVASVENEALAYPAQRIWRVDDKTSIATVGVAADARAVARAATCLLYTSPSPRDGLLSRMPSSA